MALRIRERLVAAGRRFHANDNIADALRPGELDELRAEVEARVGALLQALVIDVANDHNSTDTPRRVARMFLDEVFRGRYVPAPEVTSFPNVSRLNELMIIGPLTMRSACAHHLCPILGRVWIGVMPSADSDVIGLSKYARLCDWVMSRPQIQEEAVVMLADLLERRVRPNGLAVVLEADHFCLRWRGVRDDQARMTSSVMRGALLADPDLRGEFLNLIRRHRD